MLYVVNNFSLNMVKDRPATLRLDIREVSAEQAKELVSTAVEEDACRVAIGNDAMADSFMEHMESMDVHPPEPQRMLIAMGPDDGILWVSTMNAKLPGNPRVPMENLRYDLLRLEARVRS